jgi:hypothetical protein
MVNKTFHHPYIIVCHPYITIKISNLHIDMWQMKNVWKKIVLKIDGDFRHLFLMVLDCDTWHATNMPRGIFEFWSK